MFFIYFISILELKRMLDKKKTKGVSMDARTRNFIGRGKDMDTGGYAKV